MNIVELVRPNIRKLKPFSSARADFTGEAEVFLDANENPFESGVNRYPDPHHHELRTAISSWRSIAKESILLGNGSDELIDLLMRTFCEPGKDIVRCIQPTFGMYRVSCDINDIAVQDTFLSKDFQLDHEWCIRNQIDRNKILILCSPNNPTGNNLDRESMLYTIRNWKGIVVVDEAYIDFSDQESLISEIAQLSNLVVIQTFSKAIGAAGLRIGMCFASSEIIEYLNKVKPPYNLGSSTLSQALELLSDIDRIEKQVRDIKEERAKLGVALGTILGIQMVFISDANFFLIRCQDHLELKQFLQGQGIIVRDRSNLRGCERCLRITVGLKSENERLIQSIEEFYN